MLKIVRGISPMYGMGEPVRINNEVAMPVVEVVNEETGDTQTREEKRLMEELRKKEEELRTMEAEHKLELDRRINEESEAKLKQFLARRSESLEKERKEIIDAAKREANAITADAKATTMSVIKKAESESIKLREEARREGHDQGYSEGRTESLEKYKKYIDAAGKLLSEINARKEAYYISGEEEMRETIFDMVRKVIGEELKADPSIIDGIIGEAAKTFRNSDYIKITLAEDEISERYVTDRKLMRDIIPYIPEIEIEFDDEAEEGTVIIDNGSEIVDAGIPTQLDFLKEILRNTRGENTEDEEEFMEEIKGRTQRRKSITISADDPEPAAAVDRAADRAVETAADRAEAAVETTAAEPMAVEPEPAVFEPEPAVFEPEAAVFEPEPEPAVKKPAKKAEPKPSKAAKTARSARSAKTAAKAVEEETAMAETMEAAAEMTEAVEAAVKKSRAAEVLDMEEAVNAEVEMAEAMEAAAEMSQAFEAETEEAFEAAAEIAEAMEAAAEMTEAVEAARKARRAEAAAEIAEAVNAGVEMAEAMEAASEMASAVEAAAEAVEAAEVADVAVDETADGAAAESADNAFEADSDALAEAMAFIESAAEGLAEAEAAAGISDMTDEEAMEQLKLS